MIKAHHVYDNQTTINLKALFLKWIIFWSNATCNLVLRNSKKRHPVSWTYNKSSTKPKTFKSHHAQFSDAFIKYKMFWVDTGVLSLPQIVSCLLIFPQVGSWVPLVTGHPCPHSSSCSHVPFLVLPSVTAASAQRDPLYTWHQLSSTQLREVIFSPLTDHKHVIS